MKNKVLVTGGSGFIGSHFIELLIKKKFKVINLDIVKNKFFEKNIKYYDYTFAKCDICSKEKIKKIFKNYKFDYIVNFAAESHVDKSIDGPKKFFETNVLGTLNLLENVRILKPNVRFVQISTDEVFGSLSQNEKPFTASSNFKPNSPYSSSKASADHLARSYWKTYGINTSSTHSSNNFGERQNPEKLIPMMLTALSDGQSIPIYGNGKNIRDWIYVKENCRAVFEVMTKGKKGKNYMIGGSYEINNLNLIKKIFSYYCKINNQKDNLSNHLVFIEDRLGHDFRYSVNTSDFIKEFKFRFQNSFEKNLEVTVKHYLYYQKYYKEQRYKNKWFAKKYSKYEKR
jgi:dTDP-glucose 4,6-dehydratase